MFWKILGQKKLKTSIERKKNVSQAEWMRVSHFPRTTRNHWAHPYKHSPKRQRTKSMDGLDCRALSDSTSQGAAAGWIGYTVNLQPHPFTELSLTNFQRSSSPLMRSSLDQSDHSRPERTETTRPVLSMMVSGSCLEGKKTPSWKTQGTVYLLIFGLKEKDLPSTNHSKHTNQKFSVK